MEFEKVLQELEEIAKKMEDKNTTLDESLALFDKGVKKSSECIKVLNETKGKAELLIKELDNITKTELILNEDNWVYLLTCNLSQIGE